MDELQYEQFQNKLKRNLKKKFLIANLIITGITAVPSALLIIIPLFIAFGCINSSSSWCGQDSKPYLIEIATAFLVFSLWISSIVFSIQGLKQKKSGKFQITCIALSLLSTCITLLFILRIFVH